MDDAQPRWRSRLRRWRWLLIVLGVVIVVRAVLPYALRYVLVSQGSKMLRAKVDVGDVDLWLLQGAVSIKDFALTVPGDPEQSGTPLVAWKRLMVDLKWWPLRHKTVQLGAVELDDPRIAVERLKSGGWSYEPVLRAVLEGTPSPTPGGTPPTAAPEPTPSETIAPTEPGGETAATTHPGETPSPAAVKAGTGGPGWQFGVDRIVLRDGHVHFQDFTLPGSEPLEVTLPTIDVKDIALSPALYGAPAHIGVEMGVDQGSITVDAQLGLLETGLMVDGTVQAQRLPVRRGRLYIPKVGWADLHGELDLDVHYGLETGTRDQLAGTITLRDVDVVVADFEGPVLAWKSFKVRLDPLDLLAQRVVVAEVDLQGMQVVFQARGDDRFPVLQRLLAPSPPAGEHPDTEAAEQPAPPEPKKSAAPPWQWSVTTARISDSVLHVLAPEAPRDVFVRLNLDNLAGQGEAPATVELDLKGEAGNTNLAGKARIQPPGFAGTLKLENIDVPKILKTSAAVAPAMLPSAIVNADLTISAGMAAAEGQGTVGPGDVRVRGKIALADLQLAPVGDNGAKIAAKAIDVGITDLSAPGVIPGPHADTGGPAQPLDLQGTLNLTEPRMTFAGATGAAVSLKSLAFDIRKLSLPGVLPGSQAADTPAQPLSLQGTLNLTEPLLAQADGKEFSVGAQVLAIGITDLSLPGVLPAKVPAPATEPMRIGLDELRLDTPAVKVTRVPEGIVLPGFSMASTAAAEAPPAHPAEPPASPPAEASSARPIEVGINTLRLTKGRVEVTDRTLKPPFSGKLYPVNLQAKDVRWPAVAAKQLRLDVTTPVQGHLEVTGDVSPQGGTLQINSQDIALLPYNPYATSFSSYSVSQGSLSLKSKVVFREGHYDVTNALTLHQFNVEGGGGDTLFQKEFGIPVSMALALMRDTQGDIGFDVPVQLGEKGTELDILGIAAQALRRAIVGALASPLKLLGTFTGGDQVSVVPPSLAARPGRAELTSEGTSRAEQVGKLLAGRPAMAVALDASATQQDARWLHEQALLAQWRQQGFFGALREVAQGDTRKRVQQALEARSKDEAAQLSAEDTAALDEWLKNVPPPTAQQLHELATQRLTVVQATLHDQAGIDTARIRLSDVSSEIVEEDPVVKIQLQPLDTGTTGAPPPG